MDSRTITVHSASFLHGRGTVFYGSLPPGPGTSETLRENDWTREKRRLIWALWNHLAATDNPRGEQCQSHHGDSFPFQVVKGRLGKPCLLAGAYRGPAISFSECEGNLWAAISGNLPHIGIDAAARAEFCGDYPIDRVFHRQELRHALICADGDEPMAAALLWSIKEAAVKALGCAFHFLDPGHILVYPPRKEENSYVFPVALSGKAAGWNPSANRRSLRVRSILQEETSLSIGLLTDAIDDVSGETFSGPVVHRDGTKCNEHRS